MARRRYTRGFKESAVRLVREQGYTVPQAAKSLGVDPASIRGWLKRFGDQAGQPTAGSDAELRSENQRLRKQNAQLLIEREIVKKSGDVLRQGAAVTFAFIREHCRRWPITWMCRVLGVSRSGYHAWRNRTPCALTQRRERLTSQVRAVHKTHRGVYGSPRVHHVLRSQGVRVCVNTVAKLTRREGIAAKTKRKFVPRTTDSSKTQTAAPNRLNRDFATGAPGSTGRRWVSDITYVPTGEGWLYLAAVLDLGTRKIVGWAMAAHMKTTLVLDALLMALARRSQANAHDTALRSGARAEWIHHSDRGAQYASDDYQQLLEQHGLTVSMSAKGDCYDNAAIESFWATLKTELIHREDDATREQARGSIFEYIEVFYNRVRLHSTLGYRSPEAFEACLT